MNKTLNELIEVASFDKYIDSLEPKIAKIREELDSKIDQKAKGYLQVEELKEMLSSIDQDIANHDDSLKISGADLGNITKKSQEIKTEKELKALNIEEDLAKEKISHLNSEIERLEALRDVKQEELTALNDELLSLDKIISDLELSTKDEIDKIKSEQDKIFQKKQKLMSNMDPKISSFYEKVRKWAGDTSVVSIYKQACGGCFIRINDMVFADILNGSDIVTCPHCGRILFVDEQVS